MKCPTCNSSNTVVIETRPNYKGVRRRRECQECFQRFTTQENITKIDKPKLVR